MTINYRLGLFGYLAHPELTEESPNNSSGNYASLDQIQALKWVRDNIESFGGDPDNVTIFGESAGSSSIHTLTASPLSKGLFHRAIAQSGSNFVPLRALSQSVFGVRPAEALGIELAKAAGAGSLAEMRNLSAVALLSAAEKAEGGNFYMKAAAPIVDGWVIRDQFDDTFRRGEQHDVPVLQGYTSNESYVIAFFGHATDALSSPDVYESEIRKRYGDLADEYLEQYPANTLPQAHFDAIGDNAFAYAHEGWARLMANVSSKTYLYYFDHIPPDGHVIDTLPGGVKIQRGAYHGADVQYVFQTLSDNVLNDSFPITTKDRALANKMSDYWVAFAKAGAPNAEGLPEWRPFDHKTCHYMRFEDGEARPEKDLKPGVWELMDKILKRRKLLKGVFRDYYFFGVSSPILPDPQDSLGEEVALEKHFRYR